MLVHVRDNSLLFYTVKHIFNNSIMNLCDANKQRWLSCCWYHNTFVLMCSDIFCHRQYKYFFSVRFFLLTLELPPGATKNSCVWTDIALISITANKLNKFAFKFSS